MRCTDGVQVLMTFTENRDDMPRTDRYCIYAETGGGSALALVLMHTIYMLIHTAYFIADDSHLIVTDTVQL